MGTSTILDVIGSILIAGILMLSIFRLSNNSTEDLYRGTGSLTAQTNLATVVQILENDLRRIGYCADWKKFQFPRKQYFLRTH
jgi:type II secretory pathway component PulJ